MQTPAMEKYKSLFENISDEEEPENSDEEVDINKVEEIIEKSKSE